MKDSFEDGASMPKEQMTAEVVLAACSGDNNPSPIYIRPKEPLSGDREVCSLCCANTAVSSDVLSVLDISKYQVYQ